MRRVIAVVAAILLLALASAGTTAAADPALAPAAPTLTGATVIQSTKNDVSAPLASLRDKGLGQVKVKKEREQGGIPQIATGAPDPAVQSSVTGAAAPAASSSFEGIGQGLAGFSVQYAPPDTNGAVGPNDFVQTVNVSFAVFSKTGSLQYGPVAINTLFTGFGGLCETDNDGDPSVVYEQLADRWVITQFALTGANGTSVPFLECIAVSTTGNPMGTYNRYSFADSQFPDYPKLGVWPDAYYMSTNDFNAAGTSYVGATTWAFDRAKMLAGQPATAQTFHLSSSYFGLLPSSLDGKTPPPAGSPDYFVSLGTSTSLNLWKFHADFANANNSTLVGPTSISVAGFTELCLGSTCVPQAGTGQRLDSLADRLMYRLAYRNFGDHEALVVTHSVAPSAGGGGVRWYEIRNPGGTPVVYQQSTYAPDTKYRWMASAAMDRSGDIGVGYSLSSSSMNPAIAYTGRLAGDTLNTLQAQTILISGTGSQLPKLNRWGDYSSMVVDPVDDCTFWYTTEYLTANGTWNWHTRVGTFKFPSCVPLAAPAITSANNATFTESSAGTFTVTATGSPTPAISETGALPGSVTFTDNHNGTASLAGTPAAGTSGSYPITITAANGVTPNATQSFTLTVKPAPAVILSGTVTGNGGVPLTGTAVLVFAATSGNWIGTATTNSSGFYSISLAQGSYQLVTNADNPTYPPAWYGGSGPADATIFTLTTDQTVNLSL